MLKDEIKTLRFDRRLAVKEGSIMQAHEIDKIILSKKIKLRKLEMEAENDSERHFEESI